MANYDTYSSPDINTAYSSQFFHDLTFLQAMGINCPAIAPPRSVNYWIFTNEAPASADTVLVLPSDTVLHITDLQPLIEEAREMFIMGKRAVHISIMIAGKKFDNLYHFSKVCAQAAPKAILTT